MDERPKCAWCGQDSGTLARYCRHCGRKLGHNPPDVPSQVRSARPSRPRFSVQRVVLGASIAIVILGLAGWLARWPSVVFAAGGTPAAQERPLPSGSQSTQGALATATSTPSDTAGLDSPSSIPGLTGPAATVAAYFAAINSKDYAHAWSLGGRNTGSTYSQFVAGFSSTADDHLTVISVAGDVVTASLAAQQTDGSIQYYSGTYTVADGIIVHFDVQQTS